MYRRDGIRGGHVIMLEGRRDDGGGDARGVGVPGASAGRHRRDRRALLDAGASHVIVTSYVFRDGAVDRDRLRKLVDAVGKDRVVNDLVPEARRRLLRRHRSMASGPTSGGRRHHGRPAAACDEFSHGVDVEGMKLGIDEEPVRRLGEHSPIPVTYAGGARSIADLELVRRAGNAMVDVTVGSALDCFGGALPYDDVVAWHNEQKTLVA